eukprot:CAMPEP_0168450602 /NCGR_PEP_ID=MMETSP0228-20121227/48204_1 /TAXON_ID=133427 /ORGANISM="Protoceratium reticulatum, Strain CCCM 535 (=CCMP 1889)" /LENGTH=38 /DNA_ID= /DNA_START= /DNA_END= /DNA_ORIENTATION=
MSPADFVGLAAADFPLELLGQSGTTSRTTLHELVRDAG